MTTERARQFAIDVSWAFISSIITIPISFILRIFLARWLSVSDLGLYQMVATVIGTVLMAATFGIPTAIIKFTAEFKDEKETLNQFVTASILASLFFGSVVGFLIYAFSGLISQLFHMPDLRALLEIVSLTFPFYSAFFTLISFINGLRWMRRYAILIFFQSFSLLIFTIIIVGIMGLGLKGATYSLVLCTVCMALMAFAGAKEFFSFQFDNLKKKISTLLRYGVILLGSDVMNVISSNADILIIGYFLSQTDVGFYSIAIALGMIINLVPAAIQRITYPATSELLSKQNPKQLHIMLDKSMKYTTLLLVPMSLGIAFFSEPIVKILFGSKYLPSLLPLNILLIGRTIKGSINTPIGAIFTSVGRPDISLFFDTFGSVSSILLMVLLIPFFGISGAAFSTSFTMAIGALLFIILIPRFTTFRIDLNWYLRISFISLVSIGLYALISYLTNIYVAGVLTLALFLFALFRFFLASDDILFLEYYAGIVKKRFSRASGEIDLS